MKKYTKEILFFILFFTIALFLFMGRFLIFKESFITGDNLVQAFPWLNVYADSIKAHHFPFWVTGVHCGFPLIGEGQVGGFYPFNIVFFYFLPFRYAYNISIIFHFFIAGLFTYLFSRKWGADRWGGFIASGVFCFGAAFANIGYHVGMIRAITWFPVVMFLLENYLNEEDLKYLLLSAVVISFQMLSGSLQMALYSILFYLVYLTYGSLKRRMKILRSLSRFCLFLFIPFIVFTPQLLLTMQVVENSGRISSLDFALWGSLNPLSILTSVFPGVFRFKGHISTEDMFLGIISVLFIFAVVFSRRSRAKYSPLIAVSIVSFVFALGIFNPLYVIALKLFKFYTFRGPSRFIFFGLFTASVMTGIGFYRLFNFKSSHVVRTLRMFFKYIFFCSLLVIAGGIFIYTARPLIMWAGRFIVDRFISGAEYHRYDSGIYYAKLESIYSYILSSISLLNKNMIITLLFLAFTLLFALFLKKYYHLMGTKMVRTLFRTVASGIIFLNLFAYRYFPGGYGENVRDYDYLTSPEGPVYDIVKNDESFFRIMPYNIKSGNLPVWSIPNTNMSYDIDSIAVYSPLSGAVYRDRLDIFQIVDDSIGLEAPKSTLSHPASIELLAMLNTKYIISHEKISSPYLTEEAEGTGVFLYSLKDVFNKGFYSRDINGREVDNSRVTVIEYYPGYAKFMTNFTEKGYLVFSESFFPGWKAFINGEEVIIEKFRGFLQAVYCENSRNEVVFRYKPDIV